MVDDYENFGEMAIFLLVSFAVYAQQPIELTANDMISIPEEFENKIGSGELIKIVSEKQLQLKRNSESSTSNNTIQVVLILENYPSMSEFISIN